MLPKTDRPVTAALRCYNTLTGGLMVACRLVDWGGPTAVPYTLARTPADAMRARLARRTDGVSVFGLVCQPSAMQTRPVPCRHALAVLCSVRCARLAALVAVACVCVCVRLSVAVSEAAADVADPDHAAYFETAKLGKLYRMCTCAPVPLCVGAQLPTGRKPAVGTRWARGVHVAATHRNRCTAQNAIHNETTRTAPQ